ncbi:WxL domain-containing protein [Companilactobacillus hulinensis]|uniref:WxL domain-containing protein n=1 Tax=Companilactobacillus hulinensis TaxID=2486007 RepID=UPI000F7BB08A|nr:WxL domain-containing protein [Companilactobacillus hulinensis]
MKNLIKGTAILGAIALGAASTLVTAAAATTTPITSTSSSTATLNQYGSLTLDKVPAIDFGSQNYSGAKITYPATSVSPLHVTNPAFATGWNVTAAATSFTTTPTTTGGATSTLQGATLTLDTTSGDPITADDSTNVSTPPTAVTPVTLSTTASKIEFADVDQGIGAYTTQYTDSDVSLYVPAGNLPGAYT